MKPLLSPGNDQKKSIPIKIQLKTARSERDSARSECNHLNINLSALKKQGVDRDLFVSTLTHDLKNPIGAILMALELSKSTRDKGIADEMAKIIKRNAIVAQELISLLLDVNLIKSGGILPLSISKGNLLHTLTNCIESQAPQGGKRIILDHQNETETWGYWDSYALKRVFSNLLSNALKFSDKDSEVRVNAWQGEDLTYISFQNFGNVISLKDQNKIFDKYFKSKIENNLETEGWGLGLTLVKGIVESHSGKVDVESDSKNGTTFTIRIPNDSRGSQSIQDL